MLRRVGGFVQQSRHDRKRCELCRRSFLLMRNAPWGSVGLKSMDGPPRNFNSAEACVACTLARIRRFGAKQIEFARAGLPCVTESFPEILDERIPDDNAPSCSVRMSLAAQGLFVNDPVVTLRFNFCTNCFRAVVWRRTAWW